MACTASLPTTPSSDRHGLRRHDAGVRAGASTSAARTRSPAAIGRDGDDDHFETARPWRNARTPRVPSRPAELKRLPARPRRLAAGDGQLRPGLPVQRRRSPRSASSCDVPQVVAGLLVQVAVIAAVTTAASRPSRSGSSGVAGGASAARVVRPAEPHRHGVGAARTAASRRRRRWPRAGRGVCAALRNCCVPGAGAGISGTAASSRDDRRRIGDRHVGHVAQPHDRTPVERRLLAERRSRRRARRRPTSKTNAITESDAVDCA